MDTYKVSTIKDGHIDNFSFMNLGDAETAIEEFLDEGYRVERHYKM